MGHGDFVEKISKRYISCPVCNDKVMPFLKKALVSPSQRYQCESCGNFVKVDTSKSITIMFVFIILGWFIDKMLGSTLVAILLLLPILMFLYAAFIPFERANK